jgi:hypothetical protein
MGVYLAAYKVFKRYAYRLVREIVEHIVFLHQGCRGFECVHGEVWRD